MSNMTTKLPSGHQPAAGPIIWAEQLSHQQSASQKCGFATVPSQGRVVPSSEGGKTAAVAAPTGSGKSLII
jgi:hypothetical protein